MPRPASVALAAGTLVGGGVVGVAVVALHDLWWGLALGAAAALTTLAALAPGWSRTPFALGFAVVVAGASLPHHGGYLVSNDLAGYLLLALSLVVLIAGITTMPRPAWRSDQDAERAAPDLPAQGPSGS